MKLPNVIDHMIHPRRIPGKVKPLLATLLDVAGVNRAGLALQRARGPWIRAVNYHDIPPAQGPRFERQVAYLSTQFVPVDATTLELHLQGAWESSKPGLIITFDDGLRSHYAVVAPILAKYGWTGWFFVPSGMPDVPEAEQPRRAREARITTAPHFGDSRVFLNWDEIRQLHREHVIGSHTQSHVRLGPSLGAAQLDAEIRQSKARLESELEHDVLAFAWVGGEEYSYSADASRVIRESGYRYSFMTNNEPVGRLAEPLQLQRTNLESHMTMATVRFQLSGVMDLLYTGKRRRVNSLTSPTAVKR